MRRCRFHRQNSHTVPSSTASIDATRKSLLVQLPVGIELEVNTVSADVGAAELKIQTLEADLTSGSLSVDALTAHDADLETVSGNIDLDNTAPAGGAEVCRIDAESVSGGLTVRSVSALPAMG